MPTPEIASAGLLLNQQPQEPVAPAAIAPAWHTFVLVAAIAALSIDGASRLSAGHGPVNRLATYGFSAAMEALLLVWVLFGLRLKRIPLRSLIGSFSFSYRAIALDLSIAAAFWIGSLMVLGTLSMAWTGVETALARRAPEAHSAGQAAQAEKKDQAGQVQQAGQADSADPSQLQALRVLAKLAPADGVEIAAWILLCVLVGFVEEIVFRGYLQRQFIGWARGGVWLGVVASALIFGSAHAYQGMRGMALLAVYGALFSVLALYRRSLRAGIFAHAWHDLIAGLILALMRSNHVI